MEKRKVLLGILVLALAFSVATNIILNYNVVDVKSFDMYLTVEDVIGVNVDTGAIFFGTSPPGGSSSRNVILNHDHTTPLVVDIKSYGDLAKWVYVSDNGFLLEPKENRTIKVTATVPPDAEFGNYTGVLKINFRKPYK